MEVLSHRTDALQAGRLARVGQVEDAVCWGAVRWLVWDCGGCWGNQGRVGCRLLFGVQRGGRGRNWDVGRFYTAREQTDTVRNTGVRHKIRRMGLTHVARLLGLEESECMILEAWVPPTPGTNGDVLFFAIWCLLLKVKIKCPQKSVNIRGKGSCRHPNLILSNIRKLHYFPLKSSCSFSVRGVMLPPCGLKLQRRSVSPNNKSPLQMKPLLKYTHSSKNRKYPHF